MYYNCCAFVNVWMKWLRDLKYIAMLYVLLPYSLISFISFGYVYVYNYFENIYISPIIRLGIEITGSEGITIEWY